VDLTAAVAIFLAGVGAGTVNAVVGSGSLITFPTLLWVGYSPVLANVSNSVGLVPGNASGALGYRLELLGQRRRLLLLGGLCAVGGLIGGALLLALPKNSFRAAVPPLILFACGLVVVQPWLDTWLERHEIGGGPRQVALGLTMFTTAVYGGYFGAAQGVIVLAVMTILLNDELQRLNAAKNVLVAVVNGVAALLFISLTHVAWEAAGLIAVGSVLGGQLGARLGRRLPGPLLRALIVVVGTTASVLLLV
jgi:uncharacterized membrane protein YfcA